MEFTGTNPALAGEVEHQRMMDHSVKLVAKHLKNEKSTIGKYPLRAKARTRGRRQPLIDTIAESDGASEVEERPRGTTIEKEGKNTVEERGDNAVREKDKHAAEKQAESAVEKEKRIQRMKLPPIKKS